MALMGLCVFVAMALCLVFVVGPSMAAEFKVDPFTSPCQRNTTTISSSPSRARRMLLLRRFCPGFEVSIPDGASRSPTLGQAPAVVVFAPLIPG